MGRSFRGVASSKGSQGGGVEALGLGRDEQGWASEKWRTTARRRSTVSVQFGGGVG